MIGVKIEDNYDRVGGGGAAVPQEAEEASQANGTFRSVLPAPGL